MALFGLPPGVPAFILLVIMTNFVTILGIAFSSTASTNDVVPSIKKQGGGLQWYLQKSPPVVRALSTAIIAFPFWIWAVHKFTMQGKSDLGAFTFFFVIVSVTLVVRTSSTSSKKLLLVANVLVALNYLFPIFVFDLPSTFVAYLWIGTVYWFGMAYWNFQAKEALKLS